MTRSSLGSRLRIARLACGFSLKRAAYAMGISPCDLAYIEWDGLNCPTWLVQELAALYGVNVGKILLHPALLDVEKTEERVSA